MWVLLNNIQEKRERQNLGKFVKVCLQDENSIKVEILV